MQVQPVLHHSAHHHRRAAPVRYAVSGLPWGLTLDSTSGRISGKPWGSGTVQVTATATDATGASAGTTFALTLTWF
ncbi:putative Ig domain-containing protein [Streptomyces sp. MS1.HAVA.3]|uniref:Ig domain-containing protein n=1 Tax=Streptomyces caledonius TaxID=3134107 RepID=A0ABU8U0I9_9ACTN